MTTTPDTQPASCCVCGTHLVPVQVRDFWSVPNIAAFCFIVLGILICLSGIVGLADAPTVLQQIACFLVVLCGLVLLLIAQLEIHFSGKTTMVCPGCGRHGKRIG